ncbi:unnamed protein product [Chilo suppressalis]|uniref:Uncharacterized protein n=1 Tax=Chilo suppressalis TaxID=168631 RepID=A0ABN8B4P6_CHISP|nr:unnamed protein product [Chilo suppressalis]
MEDESDNQPSASKKESQRVASTEEIYTERRKDEERREHASNSEDSFTSGSYCARSRVEITEARPEVPKPPLGKREAKPPEKKKRSRRPGRVDKRRRSPTRRQVLRRASKRKPRKQRNLSVSTIFTRLSSQSESRSLGCKFCGHRCCRRRYELRRARRKYRKRKIKINKQRNFPNPVLVKIEKGSKQVQVGSRCCMFSPLFIKTNADSDEVPLEPSSYCEITPEMIYESLRRLTMWRQNVLKTSILEHLRTHYPVNTDDNELQAELAEKLRIAAVVGFVVNVGEDRWCLNCALQENRTLSKSHVTRFWQVYADTMTPIKRQENAKNTLK